MHPNHEIEERALLSFALEGKPIKTEIGLDEKSCVLVKNCMKEIGKGLIVIFLSQEFKGKLVIEINHEELQKHGICLSNTKADRLEYRPPFKTILIFNLKGKVREKAKFPPEKSLRIFREGSKNISLL